MISAMKMFTFLTAAFLTICTSQTAFAQETATGALTETGSTITESGSTIRTTKDVTNAIRILIPDRHPQKLKDVLVPDAKQRAWENESKAARDRLAQHRRDCREAIRRANRDQLMDRLLSCYRSDLLQDVNILRKQMQHISAIPLLDQRIKNAATGAIFELIDAEMAIVDAIDTGLFEQEDSVREARRNLKNNYRERTWLAFTRLRADWELTHVAFMVKNIEDRLTGSGTAAIQGAKAILLHDSALCLETGTQQLLLARTADTRLTASETLLQAREQLGNCRRTLKSLARKEQQEEAEKAEEIVR